MYIGVDLGGTRLHVALIKGNKIIKEVRATHLKKDRKYLTGQLIENIEKLYSKNVKGIAIGIAGSVKNGKVLDAPNISSLNGFDLKTFIKKKFKTKVLIENDVNCFAMRQHHLYKVKNLVAVTLGTGVGTGIIINDQLYHGVGAAGEIGHMVINDTGRREASGLVGTFEAYCSGTSIERRYFEMTKKKLKAKEIVKLKNKISKKIINDTGYYLGVALANIITILNPDLIVMGGSVSHTKDLLTIAKKEIPKRVLKRTKYQIIINNKNGSTVLGAVKLL